MASARRTRPLLHLTLLACLCALSCGDPTPLPPRARTLFVLGDSYALASARSLIPLAESANCDARILNLTRNGWTAEQILEAEPGWRALLADAPQPVLVYLTIGFNDMLAPGRQKTPQAAAEIVNELIETLRSALAPGGGRIVHVGYDDIWSLSDRLVYYDGKPQPLRRELSKSFDELYTALGALRSEAGASGDYRFVDVRGWLGDALGTNDGIHMRLENYAAQAALLWDRELHEPLGCERLKAARVGGRPGAVWSGSGPGGPKAKTPN